MFPTVSFLVCLNTEADGNVFTFQVFGRKLKYWTDTFSHFFKSNIKFCANLFHSCGDISLVHFKHMYIKRLRLTVPNFMESI